MKEKLKLRLWVKVVLILLIVVILIMAVFNITNKPKQTKESEIREIIKKEEKSVVGQINSVLEHNEELEENIEEQQEEVYEEPSNTYTTRMTSFWANDGYGTGECTGSGLCSWDFQTNDKGWYTYNGKLVIATATTYLANQGWYVENGVHLRKYWQELNLIIDDVEYDAIILDSCGNCMRTDRVDLFVSNGSSARDTMITVIEK